MKCNLYGTCCQHKNPVNVFFHIIALVVGVYALWYHNFGLIALAIIIALAGHLTQYTLENKGKTNAKAKKK